MSQPARKKEPKAKAQPAVEERGIRISTLQKFMDGGLARAGSHPEPPEPGELRMPVLPDKVFPSRRVRMAMDTLSFEALQYANSQGFGQRYGFVGYPFLSDLAQIQEYRALSEAPAGEMVKKWIKLQSQSGTDKTERIKGIEKGLRRVKAREMFRRAAVYDGLFGLGILYPDLGQIDDKTLGKAFIAEPAMVKRGSFRGLKLIDPIITSPNVYNANDPLADDYFKPEQRFLLGRAVHATRLLTFISRPLPDYLKPAYNFGGISMSQLAMDCVRNWRAVRDSVTEIIQAYSTSGIETDLTAILKGGGGEKEALRASLFTTMRKNLGLLMLDKEREKFFQYNVPLTTLDKLQAQAQEHMAAAGRIPLIVLLGITPTGLNASSEGELRAFYDYIAELQNILFRDNLEQVIKLIQLSDFGDIDEDITFDFEPLWQMDDKAIAAIRKDDAVAAQTYVEMGAVTSMEVRKKLATDPRSGFESLDTGGTIESVLGDPDDEEDLEPVPGAPGAAEPAQPGAPAATAPPAPGARPAVDPSVAAAFGQPLAAAKPPAKPKKRAKA